MKERPIIFSGPMVRAILDGRKTYTRRIIRLPDDVTEGPRYWTTPTGRPQEGYADPGVNYWTPSGNHIDPCPYGFPGDRLYVRERWQYYDWTEDGMPRIRYAADNAALWRDTSDDWIERTEDVWADLSDSENFQIDNRARDRRWRPSIHMPKWAARIWLEVTGVRVERLQDINRGDCMEEGCPFPDIADADPVGWFRGLWDSLNAKRAPWDSNPWVWIVEFRKLPTGSTTVTTAGALASMTVTNAPIMLATENERLREALAAHAPHELNRIERESAGGKDRE